MGKKDRFAVFGCNNFRLFPEKYTVSSLFASKALANTEREPPGHPIVPFKFNNFNMAAVSIYFTVLSFGNRL